LLEIPQYLDEAKWTADGRIVACTQVRIKIKKWI